MLAVHRPGEMGSQQPADANSVPFGYDLGGHQQFLFSGPPPEPAPGQPLLSARDAKELDGFLEGINDGNFNNILGGEGLNFTDDWLLSSLPPQYVGSTTSLSQYPGALSDSSPHDLAQGLFQHLPTSSMMPPPPPPPISQSQPFLEQNYPPDVFAAASTLSRSVSASNPANSNRGAYFEPTNVEHPLSSVPHRPLNGSLKDGRRMSQAQMPESNHNLFVDMLNGQTPRRQNPTLKRPEEVRFGSDFSFGQNNFIPQSERETSEALEKERLYPLKCLEVNKSAANTRPSSPVQTILQSPLKLKTRETLPMHMKDDPDSPARKRRKSKAHDDNEEIGDSHQRKRSKTDVSLGSASPPGGENNGKRRKSAAKAGASKAPRENLSEEQKRENHIKSEQKRRTLIKEGFDNLCDLVPGLKGGGFSKSTMLSMAAQWLEDMIRGNEQLKEQLDSMDFSHLEG